MIDYSFITITRKRNFRVVTINYIYKNIYIIIIVIIHYINYIYNLLLLKQILIK